MDCFYYIKLPNGGEIKLPASQILDIDSDSDLQMKISNYYKSLEDEKEDSSLAKKEVIKHLRDAGVKLDSRTITGVLENSEAKTFIANINTTIQEAGNEKEFISALWQKVWTSRNKFIYIQNGKESTIGVHKVIELLEQKIKPNYLSSLESTGLLGITTAFELTKTLKEKADANEYLSIDSSLERNVNTLLSNIYYGDNKHIDMFYHLDFSGKVNDSIVVKTKNSENPLIFYNSNSPVSIFLGIIKYLGLNMSLEDLQFKIKEFNLVKGESVKPVTVPTSIEKFFLDESDTISGFNSLLSTSSGRSFFVDNILPTIINLEATKQQWVDSKIIKVLNASRELVYYMNNKKLGVSVKQEEQTLIAATSEARKENTNYWAAHVVKDLSHKLETKNKNEYFTATTEKVFDGADAAVDAYNFITSTLRTKKDLIKVKYGNIEVYAVYTGAKLLANGTLEIEGVIQQNKKLIVKNFTLRKTVTKETKEDVETKTEHLHVFYRTLDEDFDQAEVQDVSEISNVQSMYGGSNGVLIHVKTNSKNSAEVFKKHALRGSYIEYLTKKGKKYSGVIKKVLPSGVYLGGNPYLVSFESIVSMTTDKNRFIDEEFTDVEFGKDKKDKFTILHEDYSKYSKENHPFLYIEQGDIVLVKEDGVNKYNRVIHSNADESYILIKSKKGYRVKAILNSDILTVWKPKQEGKVNFEIKRQLDFFTSLETFHDVNIKQNEFSYFDNFDLAEEGDFVIHEDVVYRLINKQQKVFLKLSKVNNWLEFTDEYVKIEDTDSLHTFGTLRDISSLYARDIDEVNNIRLITNKTNEAIPAAYMIPTGTTVGESILLNSGNLTIGHAGAKSYFYNEDGTKTNKWDESKLTDVTAEVVALLNARYGTSDSTLYLEEHNNFYRKFNRNLKQYRVKDFPYLKFKKYLIPHAFVSFKGINKTYRINQVGQNTVLLEYTRHSENGKIVTILKQISTDELLDTIEFFYLPYGNKKMHLINKDINDKILEEKLNTPREKKKTLSDLAERFKSVFDINTKIITNPNDLPKEHDNKKAWIVTTRGRAGIVINATNKNTNESDLVHEYLHLFLFALKYQTINEVDTENMYERLLLDYKEKSGLKTSDLNKLEESLVTKLSKFMAGSESLPEMDEASFIEAFSTSLQKLDINLDLSSHVNLFSILNIPLSEIFTGEKNPKLIKSNLIAFEASFREWVKNNKNLKIKC